MDMSSAVYLTGVKLASGGRAARVADRPRLLLALGAGGDVVGQTDIELDDDKGRVTRLARLAPPPIGAARELGKDKAQCPTACFLILGIFASFTVGFAPSLSAPVLD